MVRLATFFALIPLSLSVVIIMSTSTSHAASPADAISRMNGGPGGALILVEPNQSTALVQVLIASRIGAASDPRNLDGLTNLTAEVARHGAGGRTRLQIDGELDALGARLDVMTDLDSVQLVGTVLDRNLDRFLAIVADILLRPDFDPDEIDRTRREVLAQIDEMRTDDRALAGRFFARRLYRSHGYGHAVDGTSASLARIDAARIKRHHRTVFSGANMIIAAAGAIQPQDFRARIERVLGELPAGTARSGEPKGPGAPVAWRIQLVDKPDRKQVQIMFGHLGLPATHPDRLALSLALASFGGGFMNATLMNELRARRGLVYGAYMNAPTRRGPGPLQAWLSTGVERAVEAIKLSLRLYDEWKTNGLTAERLDFVRNYVIGAYASRMDDPHQRLAARVAAELQGLPTDFVDSYPQLIAAITHEQVQQVLRKHVHPKDLAITLVATADVMTKLLVEAKIDRAAIDVEPYDSF